jgi:hypothetical protein
MHHTRAPLCALAPRACDRTLVGMNRIILLVIILVLFLAVMPTWGYSGNWGWYPSGGIGLILIIIVLALLFGNRGTPP